MSCDEYRVLISASIDGEITEFEAGALGDHIRHCPDCTGTSDEMREHHLRLSQDRTPAQPAGLRSSIRRRLTFSTYQAEWRCEHIPMMPIPAPSRRTDPASAYIFGPCGRA